MKNTEKRTDSLKDYQKPLLTFIDIKEDVLDASGALNDDPWVEDIDW